MGNKLKSKVRQYIEKEWPSALAFGSFLPDYMITEDPTFTRERTGAGSIEYFNKPFINYGTEDAPNIILNPNGETPTLLYDPNTNTADDVKLDLLHHYREYDPVYLELLRDYEQSLLSEKNNILWNSLLGDIFRENYNNDNLEFSKHWDEWDAMVNSTPLNSLYMLQGVDGSLRNLLASDATIKSSNYAPREVAELQWLSTPESRKAFNNIQSYLTSYRLPEVTVTPKKHDDGGNLNEPLDWNKLPMKVKAAYIKIGVANGYKDIDSIIKVYNEYKNNSHSYKDGGNKSTYTPSDNIKNQISSWEGAAMHGKTIDPLSGKLVNKNRSFELETEAFIKALPSSIRDKVLSNLELADHLFSYSYNVGAGNFRRRVVPELLNYYNGTGNIDNITNSMWASGDAKLKGLRTRRAIEKEGVRNALSNLLYPIVELTDVLRVDNPYNNTMLDTGVLTEPQKIEKRDITPKSSRQYILYNTLDILDLMGALMPTYTPIKIALTTATDLLKLLYLNTLLDKYLEDSIYNKMYTNNNLFPIGGPMIKVNPGDRVFTDLCALWSNSLLRDNGYLISGNAWNLNHVDPIFNGYEGLVKPETYDSRLITEYNHDATDNIFKNFDSKTLDPTKPYVVNMYYNNSPALEEAYNNGEGVTGTHTGVLTFDPEIKKWFVTHNIHGNIHQEPFFELLKSSSPYGVTAIYAPREKTAWNKIKGFFGFSNGGQMNKELLYQI